MPFSPAIEIKALTKHFGFQIALDRIDLQVKAGETLVIFGPNGAGKTTLIRILATLSRPSSGKVFIGNLNIRDKAPEISRFIGVITHQPLLYDDMTAYENLKFYGKMFQVPDLENRIKIIISEIGLEPRLMDRVRTLSRGMQQRISLARALLHDPSLLLLDEPETGLDQQASNYLREKVKEFQKSGRLIVVTTHNLEHGLDIATKVAILRKGRLVFLEDKTHLNPSTFMEKYCQLTGVIM